MANFVNYENAEALMTGINNKKDNKPTPITWEAYQALTDEEREGNHYIISGGPSSGITAKNVIYDNSESGVDATNAQDAIDKTANRIFYGETNTSGSNITATIEDFVLKEDNIIVLKFNRDFELGRKLNINNTGAKDIYYDGSLLGSSSIYTNDVCEFVYDGSKYNLITINRINEPQKGQGYGTAINNGGYNFTASVSNYNAIKYGIVSILFTEDVPEFTDSSSEYRPTLMVNGKQKGNIVINSQTKSDIIIKANTVVTMMLDTDTLSYIIISNQALYSDSILYDTSHSVEDNFKNIEIIIPPNITNYAAYKNAGGNRGEDITKYWKDGSLADRIDGANGFKPFEDLYLWDYIDLDSDITAPSSGGGSTTGTKRIHIGEFNGLNNYQLNKRTDNTNFFNHLRMVTGTHFGMSKMNDTNTTAGGYLGSKMHTTIIGGISTSGTLAKQLYDQLGSLLVPTTELLTNSMNASGYNRLGANSGCANNGTWADVYARLLSEIESNGSIVWSSSGYDTGNAQHQLPAFKNDKSVAYPQGIYYWLKDIATSANFCLSLGRRGNALYNSASSVNYVRLLLTLGRKPS